MERAHGRGGRAGAPRVRGRRRGASPSARARAARPAPARICPRAATASRATRPRRGADGTAPLPRALLASAPVQARDRRDQRPCDRRGPHLSDDLRRPLRGRGCEAPVRRAARRDPRARRARDRAARGGALARGGSAAVGPHLQLARGGGARPRVRGAAREAKCSAALAYAREFQLAAPASVALSKRLLWEGTGLDATAMMRREAPLFAWTTQQSDAREGVVSFLEKRAPDWKLRPSQDLPELPQRVRVLVTGAGGFVGRALVARLRARGDEVIAAGRDALDVSDGERVRAALAAARPDAVAHLAAISSCRGRSRRRPDAPDQLPRHAARARGARRLGPAHASSWSPPRPCTARGGPPAHRPSPRTPHSVRATRTRAPSCCGSARCCLRGARARGGGRGHGTTPVPAARPLRRIELRAPDRRDRGGRRPARIEVGALDSVRDMLHAEDVVDAYLALLDGAALPRRLQRERPRLHDARAARAAAGADERAPRAGGGSRARPPPDTSVGSAAKLTAHTGGRRGAGWTSP